MKLMTFITVMDPNSDHFTIPVERENQVLKIQIGPDPGQCLMLKADELCEFLIRSKPNKAIDAQ